MQRALLALSRGSTTTLSSSILRRTLPTKLYTNTTTNTRSAIRTLSTLPNTPLFHALHTHDPASPSIIHSASQRRFSYGNLVADVVRAKKHLLEEVGDATGGGKEGLKRQRVAFLAENGYDYVVTLLSILASNAIALPLSPSFPTPELQYILDNAGAKVLVSTERYADKAREVVSAGLERTLLDVREKIVAGGILEDTVKVEGEEQRDEGGGMMLYTSGTTSRPKGVLLPESTLTAQATSLLHAWNYTPDDRVLHLLPLHHIHGIVNAIVAPVLAGSSIEFMFPFNPDAIWRRLAAPFTPNADNRGEKNITFLTAVPTIYTKLMSTFPSLPTQTQTAAKEAISPQNLRLNISGSAALPTPTKQAWFDLSNGNVLLERYGMTEVGMAISCGLDFNDRVDGSVGWPLPSVEARLIDMDTDTVIQPGEEVDESGRERSGEIQLRGPCVFKEYWANPAATSKAFTTDPDGTTWFQTGDVATRQAVKGTGQGTSGEWARGAMYFIRGRRSVDIIKMGGEKVSALEVERELLSLPQVAEAAVLPLPSTTWGQKVAAVIVLHPHMVHTGRDGKPWGAMDMRRALRGRVAGYKIPVEVKVLGAEGAAAGGGGQGIPRNAMGKVNKKMLARELFGV